MSVTCHVRHIFPLIDQAMKKYFISYNYLLNATIQSHPIKDGCYKSNEKCLIVATINRSCPVIVVHFSMFSLINL